MKTKKHFPFLYVMLLLMTFSLTQANINETNGNSVHFPEQSSITTSQSYLSSDPTSLNFGMHPLENTVVSSLELFNLSDALLMILSGQTGTDHFTAFMPTWSIPVGESIEVSVIFTPDDVGTFLDTLYIEHFGYWGSSILKIPLQGVGMLMPPAELTATLDDTTVILNWFPPGGSSDVLKFGNGENFSAVGTSNGTYELAARFNPVDLVPYNGKQIDEVGFFITGTNAGFTLKVYTGENAETNLISLPVSNPVANQWNDIPLPFPLPVAEIDYLWIGYEMVLNEVEFIAGVDGGPGITGSGDLLRINGSEWTTLASYNLSYNWNIRGLLSDAGNGESLVLESGGGQNPQFLPENTGFIGYNVYRNQELLTAEPITALTYTDEIEAGETWEYGVTAVYISGESEPATVAVGLPATLSMPPGWDFTPTPVVHNIHIPEEIIQVGMSLNTGDMIGVFYHDNGVEKCAGAVVWDHTHTILKAYGNEPSSPIKNGFNLNEPIYWKIYFHQPGITESIIAGYDHNMPHYDGAFKMLGLSMLEQIEMGTVGAENIIISVSDIVIYPNPSSGLVNIRGINAGDVVNAYESSGRLVQNKMATGSGLQLNIRRPGLYLIEIITNDNHIRREKLIIY